MGVFQMWKSKYLQMKAREEEKRQFLEVQATTTTTTTTTTDANFSTNPGRVRGRRSLRAQSTPTRSSMCPTSSWSWRSWILETCPCRALHRELRSGPQIEKTTIARGSFQRISEIVLFQRSPLWLVNREHSVSLSFKRAAHSNG